MKSPLINMTQRPNQTLQYNTENQLTAVTGTPSATFVYDGDGNRVLTTVGTTTTAYIGGHTEWNVSTQEMTRYYLAGGQRVAFRVIRSGQTDKVFYLLADHLGSTNVVMEVGGGVEVKTYTAWGELRTGSITSTDRQYTGQINESELGLYFYNARYYDPDLGRFISADTIVPFESQGVQAFDRFAYTNNNPIRFVDPTGHDVGCAGVDASECQGRRGYTRMAPPYRQPSRHRVVNSDHQNILPKSEPLLTCVKPSNPVFFSSAPEKPLTLIEPKSPKLDINFNLTFNPDIDWVDFGIDTGGIAVDIISYAIPGAGIILQPISSAVEIANVTKSGYDLLHGDPRNALENQVEHTTEYTIRSFSNRESAIPYIGFIGNLYGIYDNLSPRLYLKIEWR
jgi:RHS repeat-associated protein